MVPYTRCTDLLYTNDVDENQWSCNCTKILLFFAWIYNFNIRGNVYFN